MRSARLKLPPHHPRTFFHLVSRIVNRDFRLKEREKSLFVDWMRRYEVFCREQKGTDDMKARSW